MKAAVLTGDDQTTHLDVVDVPDPQVTTNGIIVDVRAAGLNRADLQMGIAGFGHGPEGLPARIPGFELAGVVAEAGENVTSINVGDEVMGMSYGAFAERVVMAHRLAIPLPAGMSFESAAALPVALLTAHDALITNARLAPGEAVLVHAASCAVGIAALQIARQKAASAVIGTTTHPDKLETLGRYGLTLGIDAASGAFADPCLEATHGRGVDVIIDLVGRGYLASNIDSLALLGRLVSVGRLGGVRDEIDLDDVARKRLRLIGVTFRTRTLEEHVGVVDAFKQDLGAALMEGRFEMPVAEVLPLEQIATAYERLSLNAHVGKIVLTV